MALTGPSADVRVGGTIGFFGGITGAALFDTQYQYGGWRVVWSTADRDAIPEEQRQQDMRVLCNSDGKTYKLGSDLTTWTEVTGFDGNLGDSRLIISQSTGGLTGINITFDHPEQDTLRLTCNEEDLVIDVVDGAPGSDQNIKLVADAIEFYESGYSDIKGYFSPNAGTMYVNGDYVWGDAESNPPALGATGASNWPYMYQAGTGDGTFTIKDYNLLMEDGDITASKQFNIVSDIESSRVPGEDGFTIGITGPLSNVDIRSHETGAQMTIAIGPYDGTDTDDYVYISPSVDGSGGRGIVLRDKVAIGTDSISSGSSMEIYGSGSMEVRVDEDMEVHTVLDMQDNPINNVDWLELANNSSITAPSLGHGRIWYKSANDELFIQDNSSTYPIIKGPTAASSTDHALARWDGTNGSLVQDSNATLDDTGNLTVSRGDTTNVTVSYGNSNGRAFFGVSTTSIPDNCLFGHDGTDTVILSGDSINIKCYCANSSITLDPAGDDVIIASGDVQLSNAYTAGAPSPTGYLILKDSNGTRYKIPAEAV